MSQKKKLKNTCIEDPCFPGILFFTCKYLQKNEPKKKFEKYLHFTTTFFQVLDEIPANTCTHTCKSVPRCCWLFQAPNCLVSQIKLNYSYIIFLAINLYWNSAQNKIPLWLFWADITALSVIYILWLTVFIQHLVIFEQSSLFNADVHFIVLYRIQLDWFCHWLSYQFPCCCYC